MPTTHSHNYKPFTSGPIRPKKVLSLGSFRTGSQSVKTALEVLGYKDVFHSTNIPDDRDRLAGFAAAVDHNIPALPSYTGREFTREDWDAYYGPCEALTDVTPFAESMLRAYPEAKVLLVYRDFEAWADSFEKSLLRPAMQSPMAQLCGNVLEPFLGIQMSQTLWKLYLGILGVSTQKNAANRTIMRVRYEAYYANICRLVPADNLLELNLADLDWPPLCKFLGKDVPDIPFPRGNDSKTITAQTQSLQRLILLGAVLKALSIAAVAAAVGGAGFWAANHYHWSWG